MYFFKLIIILIISFNIINCAEKIKYSGKNFEENNLNYGLFNNKKEVINILGTPSYIDPIEKKYLYYSQKKFTKNFFDEKIIKREIHVFEFDEKDLLISYNKINLDDENKIDFIKNSTPNVLIKRGWLEKIFGGIGNNNLPSTP